MLASSKNRQKTGSKDCPYGCCRPHMTKKQTRRKARRFEKRQLSDPRATL